MKNLGRSDLLGVDVAPRNHLIRRRMSKEHEAALAILGHRHEGDAGLGARMHPDWRDVDSELCEALFDEAAEIVGTDESHQTRPTAELGQGNGHVCRSAAQMTHEAIALGERAAGTLGKKIDQRFAEAKNIGHERSAWFILL